LLFASSTLRHCSSWLNWPRYREISVNANSLSHNQMAAEVHPDAIYARTGYGRDAGIVFRRLLAFKIVIALSPRDRRL
jgi:hypothetical protein